MNRERGMEFSVNHYDEDTRDDAEAGYRELDPENFPVDGDTTQGNDVILAAYREGIEPGRSFNSVSVVGTGGSGFYEREWQGLLYRESQSDHPRLDDTKMAMAYAGEIGRPYDLAVNDAKMAFIGLRQEDRAGNASFDRNIREILTGHGTALGEIDAILKHLQQARALEHSEFGASDYRERHPDDWSQRASRYLDACQDLVDCGKNEVMLGLLNDDEGRIATGRALMSYGAQLVQDVVDDGNDIHLVSDLRASALVAESHDAKSAAYIEAFAAIREVSGNWEAEGPTSDAYWARAVLNAEFSQRYHENIGAFADLDPGKSGGTAFQMRAISDVVYKLRLYGPLNDAVDALATGDGDRLRTAFEQDAGFNESLHALAYRFQNNAPAVDLSDQSAEKALERAMAAHERYQEFAAGVHSERHPMPEVAAALMGQAGEMYRSHVHMMNRLAQGDESSGNSLYSLRSAQELEYMARPEVLLEALEHLRQHPGWRQEAAERRREYWG